MSTQGKEGWGWALGTQTLPVTLQAEWLGRVCAVDLQLLKQASFPPGKAASAGWTRLPHVVDQKAAMARSWLVHWPFGQRCRGRLSSWSAHIIKPMRYHGAGHLVQISYLIDEETEAQKWNC